MKFKQISRRRFIKGSVVAGAALTLPHSKVLGANGDIRLGIIGCGDKGTGHVGDFSQLPGVRLVAVSDVDTTRMDNAVGRAAGGADQIAKYQDFRQVLDAPNIDAVVIATPNHWHAPITVMACQAGKDVYVEKPVSHGIWEGRKMVEAARKYGRIVQAGTQQRSDPALIEAAEAIRNKEYGEVQWVNSFWNKMRASIGKVTAPTPVPDYVDYDLWCGPRPNVPLMRKNLHYDWHWQWPYGNGDMGNLNAHMTDDIRHLLGMTSVPRRVMSVGGRFAWDDDGQTPNSIFTLYDSDVPIVLGNQALPYDKDNRSRRGDAVYSRFGNNFRWTNIVKCEDGFIAVTRGGGYAYDNDGERIKQFVGDGGAGHSQNFIDAVRSRKSEDLNADIPEGHFGAVMTHQANISYRLGVESSVDEIRERVSGTEEAVETLKQMVAHLHNNEIDLENDPLVLGPWLNYDDRSERFTGEMSDEANALLKDSYREPFVVPNEV